VREISFCEQHKLIGTDRSDSVEDPVRRGQRQVEQVRIKIGMQMDDKTFQQTLLETNVRPLLHNNVSGLNPSTKTKVILTKDHTKWNLDVLQDVIEGPLLNHKRIEEAIKVSKFMRKLMSFFHPFSHRFADMPRRVSLLLHILSSVALR
jgi:rapamycin-insensitive companion of mTOR